MTIENISKQQLNKRDDSWLTPLHFIRREKRGNQTKQLWLFQCKCGKYKELLKSYYQTTLVKSCGCARFGNKNAIKNRKVQTVKSFERKLPINDEIKLSFDKNFGGMF